jgi:hypothetical protein
VNSIDNLPPPPSPARSEEGLKSLVKVVRVLDTFSRTDRALSLAEICHRTGYPKSTTHRLLASMRAGLSREKSRIGEP